MRTSTPHRRGHRGTGPPVPVAPAEDLRNLLGAVAVEVETGMEIVEDAA